ncbi:hemolysin family protein [Candidatus Kapabacteria bacterium]|nr:hemolysin family protein [Candidatus Kapabacteria bacterium]
MKSLIFYLFIAIFISFICSILEAVILSVSQSFIQIKSEEGKSYTSYLSDFKRDIDKPLSAILTLNTFAHTIGAAGVGFEAQNLWGEEYLTLTSAIVTILILVFSEIIPKTIGASYWKFLAGPSTYILRFLTVILYPFVFVMQIITKLIAKGKNEGSMSKHELSIITEMSEKDGLLRKDESKIIKNLLKFSDILAENIMTPRTVVVTVEESTSIQEVYENNMIKHFSRIPIFKDELDNITGYVLKNELLQKMITGEGSSSVSTTRIPVLKVSEKIPLPDLYEKMIKLNEHIVIVQDEYQGFAGLVSTEDIIETLLGIEITDESDQIEDLQKFARKNWEYRAKKLGILAENIIENSDEIKKDEELPDNK